MSPCSLQFLIFILIALLLFYATPTLQLRKHFLGAVNFIVLAQFIPNWQSWVSLLVFLAGSYLILAAAPRIRSGKWLAIGSAAFIAGFLYIRKYAFLAFLVPDRLLDHPVEIVGISYMLFKFLHVLVDARQGQIPSFGFPVYVNYQLSFFTLIAGPIQRFSDFRAFWENIVPDAGNLRRTLDAWNRILNGMLKMGVLASAALYLYTWSATGLVESQTTPALLGRFATYLYAYPLYIYFNFSGYTDIMLGCGYLFGLNLPENFNRPYLSRNVLDFWSRWHMSLTAWIRDYVFMTSYKWAVERHAGIAPVASYALLFLSLFVAGVWHGSTLNFVIFGVIHGTGAAVTQMYGTLLRKRLKTAGMRRYNQNAWIRGTASIFTLQFVSFSFLFFPADLGSTLGRLRLVAGRLAG